MRVLATAALDGHRIEAVIQVLAKLTSSTSAVQILIRRRQDAHLRLQCFVAADRSNMLS